MPLSSKKLLEDMGYVFLYKYFEGVEPSYSSVRFRDIVSELSGLEIGGSRLYRHQKEGYDVLCNGYNLILRSGTGSGKTEVWVLYGLNRVKGDKSYRILALYPTLALANDQIRRINKYFSLIGVEPLQIDSVKRSEYVQRIGRRKLRELIGSSNIVISNPAFILHDIKRMMLQQTRALLYSVYRGLDLLIIDEIDFYGPRSLALLLAIIKLLSEISEHQIQVVVLTATLSNPDDLGKYLEEVTGRKYIVVEGKPFSIPNHMYIVLGKNLSNIWEKIRRDRGEIYKNIREEAVKRELEKALESYDYFVKNIYRILSILSTYGYETPSLSTDAVEIISSYLRDEYVTIVFTNSISMAEELVRNIKNRYGENQPIASHHHLVSKKKREEIEEKARKGLIKVIVSPRTLSQGIDIGTVARIVHLGLPDDVREYHQREGRKGRRREIGFSETIIIPYSRWDRELLSRGFNVFEKWLEMGFEKTIINPDNLYTYLFLGIAKLYSPWYRRELDIREKTVLEKIGVLTHKGLNQDLVKWIYERLNFYEFAPPYGVKRYLVKGGELIPLEPIGHCDLVEKFQPGNIDYSEEAIITDLEIGRSTRYVRAVYEKPLKEINFFRDDALAVAYEEYRYYKLNWNEKPNILRDILAGRLTSEELCVVYVPWNGFGKYRKIPDRCIWKLRSEKPRVRVYGDNVLVYYDRRQIYVPKPTGGEYRDYTYGYIYSVDPGENSDLLRLALAVLMIILRRVYGIGFETIMYDVLKIGEYKYFTLHEPEAAGIIDKIDWLDVRHSVEKYVFDELDPILLSEIDDISYSILVSYDFDWELIRRELLRVIDYILVKNKIRLVIGDREIAIPKPSPGLKLLALSLITEVLGEETEAPRIFVALNIFDGDKNYSAYSLYPPIPYFKPPEEILGIEKTILDKLIYEDYKLVIPNYDKTLYQLKTANLRQLVMVFENYRDKIIDLTSIGHGKGIDPFSYEALIDTVKPGIDRIDPSRVRELFIKIRDRNKVEEYIWETLKKYLEIQSLKTYLAYLVLENL